MAATWHLHIYMLFITVSNRNIIIIFNLKSVFVIGLHRRKKRTSLILKITYKTIGLCI